MAKVRIRVKTKTGEKVIERKVRDIGHLRSQQTFRHNIEQSKKRYKRRHKFKGRNYDGD